MRKKLSQRRHCEINRCAPRNDKKGFTLVETIVTLVIAGIFMAITIGVLISTTNLSAHAEKNLSAKQITTEVLEFLAEQTKYATEITPVNAAKPVASNAAVSAATYTMPTSDKIKNGKWPNPSPWIPQLSGGISIPSEYDDWTYEEKLAFFDALSDEQKKPVSDASYANNLIFYVGDESGAPATPPEPGKPATGYLFFKRADDSGTPINAFGKNYYGNRKISIDFSEIQDPATSKIIVTETVNIWEGDQNIRTIQNSFELVNIDADADGDTFDDWDKDKDDITIIGATDPPHYYICKDVKYFDW
jgi:prepilin-type N-terminal cleavage/methylation domain-containing protein